MNISIPQEVNFIIETLKKNNYDAYAVGGCVRDSILKRTPNDWDITTNALPEQILELFEHTIPTGLKHGTVTIILNKLPFEVTTFRIDGEYSDNRHPDEVLFTNSLKEDLSRRDFTINAMAYNDLSGITDPFNGREDLENHIVRCVGDPNKRFNEDALRMLRAIRFAGQLNFNIDKETFASIKLNSQLIAKVSVERIREEFCKILLCDKPSSSIIALENSGLLEYVLPELRTSIGFDQKNPHHDKNVFEHILSVIDYSPKELSVRLSALLHDIGKPVSFTIDDKGIGHFYGHELVGTEISEAILKRLKFDNVTIKKVLILVKEHMNRFSKLKNSSLKKLMVRVGVENLKDLFDLQEADIKASAPPYDLSPVNYLRERTQKILEENEPLTIKDLAIKGSDLMELGIKPGKTLGDILNSLLEVVIEYPELNTKEYLIQETKKLI